MLVFRCLDCQCLFVSHTKTGHCITVCEKPMNENLNDAFIYYVKLTENCLDGKAQFRYLDSQLLQNIEKNGTLVSPSAHYKYFSRWCVYKGVSKKKRKYQYNVKHRLKQTAAGALLFYNREDPVCAVRQSSKKYLLRVLKHYCEKSADEFVFGK